MKHELLRIQEAFIENTKQLTDLSWIKAKNQEDKELRFNVYKKGSLLRFKEALVDDFPTVVKLLGEKEFHKLFLEFAYKHPSKFTTLNEYGSRFPLFLNSKLNELNDKQYIPELAEFEWNLIDCYYRSNSKDNKKDKALIEINNYVILQKSTYPIDKIYTDEVGHTKKQSFFIFYQINSKAYYDNIKEWQYKFFELIKKGKTLEHAVDHINAEFPNLLTEENIQAFFQKWSANSVIIFNQSA